MIKTSNFLQAAAIEDIRRDLKAAIAANSPADEAALLTLMDAIYDSTVSMKGEVYKQILKGVSDVHSGGQLVDGITITDGGTGFTDAEVGALLPVTGATSGSGGAVRVTSHTAGVIDGVELWSVGDNYVGALTVDTSGVGNGDAVITMDNAANYDGQAVIDATLTKFQTLGSASAVAVNAGGTGYTEDDVLTLANGIVIVVGVTAGAVTSVKSITTNVANLDADATGVACTGGTGNDDATFDVTANVV